VTSENIWNENHTVKSVGYDMVAVTAHSFDDAADFVTSDLEERYPNAIEIRVMSVSRMSD